MIINLDNLQFNIIVDSEKLNNKLIPLIFLHGFTGSANDWDFIFKYIPNGFLPVAIDLIGHGKSSSPIELDYYSPLANAGQLDSIFTRLGFNKVIICGYSMGGRAALNYAAHHPQNILGLILESATKGFSSETEKMERLKNDFILAEKITADGMKNFINYWMSIPLFNSLKNISKEKYDVIFNSKFENSTMGLSNSLRGFSTGNMNINLSEFNKYSIPVLLITGGLDQKFTNINKILVDEFKSGSHEIIKEAGHNTHVEAENVFIEIVNKFLIKFL